MRILQVNKFHYPRGGADKYYLQLGEALQAAGHEVAYFSMQHPKNLPCAYEKYFVSRLSFNEGGLRDKLIAPGRIIYSLEAKRKFARLLKDFQPDIIHIHNIYHQLSPSILDAAKAAGVPVVMHVHDYKLICPNYQLFVNGSVCEACRGGHYCQATKKKCLRDSRLASLLASLEMYLHHTVLKIYKKNISLFLAPSQFMKDKLVSFQWPADKIRVIVNPFDPQIAAASDQAAAAEDYLLYFGRLSPEKGLPLLIEAAARTGWKVKIAGSGPQDKELRSLAIKLAAPVEFLGFQEAAALTPLIGRATAVIIPSIWYENMPLSLLEALSLGTPVIAANIGGMPEIIRDGVNGFLFAPNDLAALIRAINNCEQANRPALAASARASVAGFTPQENLQAVLQVYQEFKK